MSKHREQLIESILSEGPDQVLEDIHDTVLEALDKEITAGELRLILQELPIDILELASVESFADTEVREMTHSFLIHTRKTR